MSDHFATATSADEYEVERAEWERSILELEEAKNKPVGAARLIAMTTPSTLSLEQARVTLLTFLG